MSISPEQLLAIASAIDELKKRAPRVHYTWRVDVALAGAAIGYDGDHEAGRIFRIGNPAETRLWAWSVTAALAPHFRSSLACSGTATSAYDAAVAHEGAYDTLMQRNWRDAGHA